MDKLQRAREIMSGRKPPKLSYILVLIHKERDGTLSDEEREALKEYDTEVQELKELLEA